MAKPKKQLNKVPTLHEDVYELFTGPTGKRVLAALRKRFHDIRVLDLDLGSLAHSQGQREVYLILEYYASTQPNQEDNEHVSNGTDDGDELFNDDGY